MTGGSQVAAALMGGSRDRNPEQLIWKGLGGNQVPIPVAAKLLVAKYKCILILWKTWKLLTAKPTDTRQVGSH